MRRLAALSAMIVGLCELTFRLRGVKSLKAKRSIVRKITERVRHRFPVSIAESGAADSLDRAVIGFSSTGSDATRIDGYIDSVIRYVEELYLAPIVSVEREVFSWTEAYNDMEWAHFDGIK